MRGSFIQTIIVTVSGAVVEVLLGTWLGFMIKKGKIVLSIIIR